MGYGIAGCDRVVLVVLTGVVELVGSDFDVDAAVWGSGFGDCVYVCVVGGGCSGGGVILGW